MMKITSLALASYKQCIPKATRSNLTGAFYIKKIPRGAYPQTPLAHSMLPMVICSSPPNKKICMELFFLKCLIKGFPVFFSVCQLHFLSEFFSHTTSSAGRCHPERD